MNATKVRVNKSSSNLHPGILAAGHRASVRAVVGIARLMGIRHGSGSLVRAAGEWAFNANAAFPLAITRLVTVVQLGNVIERQRRTIEGRTMTLVLARRRRRREGQGKQNHRCNTLTELYSSQGT